MRRYCMLRLAEGEYLVIDTLKGDQIYIESMCAVKDYKKARRITAALNFDEEHPFGKKRGDE